MLPEARGAPCNCCGFPTQGLSLGTHQKVDFSCNHPRRQLLVSDLFGREVRHPCDLQIVSLGQCLKSQGTFLAAVRSLLRSRRMNTMRSLIKSLESTPAHPLLFRMDKRAFVGEELEHVLLHPAEGCRRCSSAHTSSSSLLSSSRAIILPPLASKSHTGRLKQKISGLIFFSTPLSRHILIQVSNRNPLG